MDLVSLLTMYDALLKIIIVIALVNSFIAGVLVAHIFGRKHD